MFDRLLGFVETRLNETGVVNGSTFIGQVEAISGHISDIKVCKKTSCCEGLLKQETDLETRAFALQEKCEAEQTFQDSVNALGLYTIRGSLSDLRTATRNLDKHVTVASTASIDVVHLATQRLVD